MKCKKCGYENDEKNIYCENCGAELKLKIEEEKRVVSILFADLKGFTSLSEKLSPEEVKEIMDKIFSRMTEIIENNRGYIDKYIGDCIMALFGAPVSYGDDAERAVKAAYEMQEKIKEFNKEITEITKGVNLSLRIGINTGEVVTGYIGKKREGDYTAMGDAVNIAERIEEICEPGKIWVSENTYNFAKRIFEFIELPKVKLKGKKEEIKIYEVKGYKKIEKYDEIFLENIFINREKEMEIIKEKYNEAKEKSVFLFLTGDIGIGKTRFLKEFEKIIKDECKIYWIYPDPSSFSILKGFSGFLKRFYPLREFMKEDEIKREAGEYLDFALFPDKVNIKFEKEEEIKNILCYAFSLFLEFLCKKNFCVFIVENAHLLDNFSIGLIKYLSETIKDIPFLFILSVRTSYYENFKDFKNFFEIKLEPLSYEEMRKFIKSALNVEELDEEIYLKIYQNTFGNPLYTVNILPFLKKELSLFKIPSIFLEFGRAVLDKLEEEEKNLLAILACLGEKFDIELISYIKEEKKIKLHQKIRKLISAGIIEQEEDDKIYRFKSPRYREIILESLLKRTRENLHNFVAEKIESNESLREKFCSLIAYNYEKANKKEKSIFYYKIAFQKSIKNFLYEEGINYLKKIIELSEDEKEKENAKIEMGKYLSITGKIKESEEILMDLWENKKNINALIEYLKIIGGYKGEYKKVIEIIEKEIEIEKLDYKNKCEILYLLGEAYHVLRKLEEAEKYYFKVLNILKEHDPFKATVLNALGGIYYYKEEIDKAIYHYKEALKENEKHDVKDKIILNFLNLGYAYYKIGKYDEGLEYQKRALSLAESIKSKHYIGIIYQNIGYYYFAKGETPKAIEYFKKAIDIFTIFQKKKNIALIYNYMRTIYIKQCLYEEALDITDKSIQIAKELHLPNEMANALYGKSRVYLFMGNTEKAKELNEESLKISQENNIKDMQIVCLINFGDIFLTIQPEKSFEFYKKSLEILEDVNIPFLKFRALIGLCKLYLILNEINKSLEYFEKAKEINRDLKSKDIEGEIYVIESLFKKNENEKKDLLIKGIEIAQEIKNYRLLLRALYFLSLIDKNFENRFEVLLNQFLKDLKNIELEKFLQALKFIE
ncbi:MAG: adenylate/guanylate cyclase domain-containing protein [candidate division WOR-3 bacterium]